MYIKDIEKKKHVKIKIMLLCIYKLIEIKNLIENYVQYI